MKHVKTHIDEFLKGELSGADRAHVTAHLESCAECREYADWVKELNRAAAGARIEPPEHLVDELHTRLLALPAKLSEGELRTRTGRSAEPMVTRLPSWLTGPAPLLRVAALILIGIFIGYGFWGGPARRERTGGAGEVAEAPALQRRVAETAAAPREAAVGDLEARVQKLERALLATYFAKVEAAMTHFVTSATEGEISPPSPETTENILSMTASLKADCKTCGDSRMARLYGQIESILLEMDQLSRDRDLSGARYVATVIEEEGLLSTLQRLKVGLEE